MILAGAAAVEVGTAFFRDVHAGAAICAGLPEIMERLGCKSLAELRGKARN
jgi:dihydroorotate dehydrogenase (NAD+) catalytic subunit